ncbi:MAG: ABC transporter permease [Thermoplasmatales archaeon]
MELRYYIIKRLIAIIPTIIGVTVLTFILVRSIPVDLLVSQYVNPNSTVPIAVQKQNAITSLGLNLPAPVEYFIYLKDLFTGSWGSMTSSFYSGPVLRGIEEFFPNTLQLSIFAMILSIVIAIPLGTYMGSRPNSIADHIGRIVALSGYAMPLFWLALILQIVFGRGILRAPTSVLPISGTFSYSALPIPPPHWLVTQSGGAILSEPTHMLFFDSLIHGDFSLAWDALLHLVLPVLTLTYGLLAYLLRFIRSGVVDSSRQEFTRTARAKGMPENIILKKHIRRNGILPSITTMGLIVAFLLGGVVLVEEVFQYPGIGLFSVNAVLSFQIYGVMGTTFVFALIVIAANFIVDLVYVKIDPRIKY